MRQIGRPILVTLTCLCLILSSMWLLSETILHLHFFYNHKRWIFQENKNFRVTYTKPTSDRREYTLRENAREGLYHINAQGFRSPELPSHLADNLICVVGDSVPFGSGVSNDNTFPIYLEQVLTQQGHDYRVLNGGVASYNLRQSFDRWRFDIQPQYHCEVLVVNAANDVSLIDFYREKWHLDVTWADKRFQIQPTGYSALRYYVFRGLKRIRAIQADGQPYLERALFSIKKMLKRELDAVLAKEISIVLMPVNPCYYQSLAKEDQSQKQSCSGYAGYSKLIQEWDDVITGINTIIKDLSNEYERVYFLDTVQFLDHIGREKLYLDFIHFFPKGNYIIAEKLAKFLEERQLLKGM